MDVYGSPGGRDFHNALINNHLDLIDWINVMSYTTLSQTESQVSSYIHAPQSQWYQNDKLKKLIICFAGTTQ